MFKVQLEINLTLKGLFLFNKKKIIKFINFENFSNIPKHLIKYAVASIDFYSIYLFGGSSGNKCENTAYVLDY